MDAKTMKKKKLEKNITFLLLVIVIPIIPAVPAPPRRPRILLVDLDLIF
jgi:hypothetical protein